MKKIGTISLGKEIIVTDPCYDPNIWCARTLEIKEGNYNCLVDLTTDGRKKIKSLAIKHADLKGRVRYECEGDFICVDSGQAGFFNKPYYLSKQGKENDMWYKRICDITDNMFGTIDNSGCVSLAGNGDGDYGMFVHRGKDGVVDAVKIDFMRSII